MADHAHSVDSQERGAAIFGIIDFFCDILEGGTSKEKTNLGQEAFEYFFLQHLSHCLCKTFRELEDNVPDETVTDNHIHNACKNVPALNVSNIVYGDLLQ